MSTVLNVKETARFIGRSINNTLRMLHDGTIPAIRVDKRWMVSKAVLDDWLIKESERQAEQRKQDSDR